MADHANDLLYLDGLIEQLRKRAENVNTFWLKSIGERIRELKKMDPSDKAGIDAIRNDTTLLADLEDAIRNLGQDTMQDAKAMLSIAARLSLEASPVAKGLPLESWISGVAEATHGRLRNIANTSVVGVVTHSGFMTPGDAYKAMIDQAAAQMASGKMGLNAAVRSVLKQFADSGLAVVEYESGRTRSLGAAIEMNLKEATSQVYQGVQRRVGQEFGADGVEISAHGDCAPDHLDIQGRQFTLEAYEKLNNSLSRPIGTMNCRHTIYTIIIGVSEPTYSDEELAEMRAKSLAVQEFDGKHMTTYEASQMQRRLERGIRQQKYRSVIAKAAGDDVMRREAQLKINEMTGKYKELSDAFGLKTKAERMAVRGYRRVEIPKQLPAAKNLLISKTTPDNDIIIGGVNAIKDALLHGKTSDEICEVIINNHWSLRHFTPESMHEWLKSNGFDVKSLKGKNYKDLPFEEGGGFRIHFGNDGIFLYHPGEKSHHGGAYWRASNGKLGDNRYDMDGNQIFN